MSSRLESRLLLQTLGTSSVDANANSRLNDAAYFRVQCPKFVIPPIMRCSCVQDKYMITHIWAYLFPHAFSPHNVIRVCMHACQVWCKVTVNRSIVFFVMTM
jgi:hypothetical protein